MTTNPYEKRRCRTCHEEFTIFREADKDNDYERCPACDYIYENKKRNSPIKEEIIIGVRDET